MNSTFQWISDWFKAYCDGDWEHEHQIKVYTVSNPGWCVEIDLNETGLSEIQLTGEDSDISDQDWFFYHVRDSKFVASGDLSKLDFLLKKFRKIVENHS